MDIAHIFKKYSRKYLEYYKDRIPLNHVKVINDIMSCRTSVLGGEVYYCEKCDNYHYSYHSCKNRHCPKCGKQNSQEWLENQKKKLLPVPYFMITFTIPQELRAICRSNQKFFYSTMFKASSKALRTLLNDVKYAGGESGFTGVLHTWTRQLHYHPHIHYIVPAGAFDFERNSWNKSRHKFLVPVKALSKKYREYFEKLVNNKPSLYNKIPHNIWREKEFISNSKSVGKGDKAFTYLANYVYKTAITNNRIMSCKNGEVVFQYKDSKTNEVKYQNIKVFEFMRRFLQHTLPSGFQKVRYFGFLSSASKTKWESISNYFDIKPNNKEAEKKAVKINTRDYICKHCKSKMIPWASILKKPRSPPELIIKALTNHES